MFDRLVHSASIYTDAETGLQLLTHRYYDPSRGRFLTRDPVSYHGGINLYSYVRNNPIGGIDPSGEDPPSSVYTDLRSKNSAGHGYILDFGPELNAKFQDALLHAYDGGWFGRKRSYDPIKDNCGQAFNKAFNAIAADLGMKPNKPGIIAPWSIEEFINNNLRKYIAATTPYPKQ